jgi:hypothetical protein
MNCGQFILLLLSIPTFGQTYYSALSDYEVENFITWEIRNSKDTTNYFAGQEKRLPYYTKSKNWTDLLVIFEFERETAFEGLFREVLADSTLQIEKREIERQYQEIRKDIDFDFIKQIKEIQWTNKLVKSTPTIGYSVPITNKQKDIVIVCKDYAFNNGNATIRGEYYIKIYLKSNGSWKLHRSLACGY